MSEAPETAPLPEGARCAIHPERSAERTCVRCGNYLCAECTSSAAAGLCLTCESRVGKTARKTARETAQFQFTRSSFSLDGLVSFAFTRWKEHWPALLVVYFVAAIVVYGVGGGGAALLTSLLVREDGSAGWLSELHPVRLGVHVFTSVLQTAVNLVVLGACFDALCGRPIEPHSAMSRLKQLPHGILLTLLSFVVIGADIALHAGIFQAFGGFAAASTRPFVAAGGTFLVLLPVRIYVWLGVAFSIFVLAAEPESTAIDAIRTSWRMASGQRLAIFGIGLVALVITLLGVVACCVGVFVTAPIATLIMCGLYLALSNFDRAPA